MQNTRRRYYGGTLMEPLSEPADLGVRIGTKKEVFLEKVRKAILEELEQCEHTADLNKDLLIVLDQKIKQEKEMFK